jgi:hypothetical protein
MIKVFTRPTSASDFVLFTPTKKGSSKSKALDIFLVFVDEASASIEIVILFFIVNGLAQKNVPLKER